MSVVFVATVVAPILCAAFFLWLRKPTIEDAKRAYARNKPHKAIEICKKLAEADPNDPIPHFLLYELYSFRTIRKDNLRKAERHKAFGTKENAKKCLVWARKATERDSSAPAWWGLRGVAAGDIGLHHEELSCYLRALSLYPPGSHFTGTLQHDIGLAYLALKNWDKALEYIRQAMKLGPKDARFVTSLAVLYGGKGEHKKAIEYYRKAIALKPDYGLSYFGLALSLKTLKRYKEALEAARRAVELVPDAARFWFHTGELYWLNKNLQKARWAYKKASDLDQRYLSDYHFLSGPIEKARETYKKASDQNPVYLPYYHALLSTATVR